MVNLSEFESIRQKFGGCSKLQQSVVEYSNERFFQSRQAAYRSERRGEVVFVVERPSGSFVVTRMSEYPEGIYRLPSGGISYGEDVVDALNREICEELGIKTEIVSFLGLIEYSIRHKIETASFSSYVFHVKEIGGRILLDAQDNEISSFKEVSIHQLSNVSKRLRVIEDSWRDWGHFRAIVIDFVVGCLGNNMGHC